MEEKNHSYGVKELESILIKATSNIRIGNIDYEEGETVIAFKHASSAYIYEGNSIQAARGGINNYAQVIWESPRDIVITFSDGILSDNGISMLLRAGLINKDSEIEPIQLSSNEVLPGIGEKRQLKGKITKMFAYSKINDSWEKFYNYTLEDNYIILDHEHALESILVDYTYEFISNYKEVTLSAERLSNNFRIECTGILKDSTDGTEQKVCFVIPKARLQGNFNIRLGDKVSPSVETFRAIGMPITENGVKIVSKLYILENKELTI